MPYQISLFGKNFTLLLATILLASCAIQPEAPEFEPPVFPAPPAEPRFVYEASLRSSSNIVDRTFSDTLKEIATGMRVDPDGLAKPYGVAAKHNRVYVTDTQQRAILVFDLNKRAFEIIGTEGQGRLLKPLGITISSKDEIFVADITAKRIVIFDLNGNYKREIKHKNLLERPVGIAVSPDAKLAYVVDTGGIESINHRVHIFNAESGAYIASFGTRGQAPGQFNLPLQASTASDGTLFVVDSANFRVQAFKPSGEFLYSFGSLGRQSGQFSRPKGIAVDKSSNVYVVDTAFGNFQIFDAKGTLLLFVGNRSTSGGPASFSLPAGITVDENGRIYVVDQFFRKVDIFRPIDTEPLDVFTP